MTIKIPEWVFGALIFGCTIFGFYAGVCGMVGDMKTKPWRVITLCSACDEEVRGGHGCCPYCADYPLDIKRKMKRSYLECTFLANCFTSTTVEWKECEDVDSP